MGREPAEENRGKKILKKPAKHEQKTENYLY
jgi:hypothetical protein